MRAALLSVYPMAKIVRLCAKQNQLQLPLKDISLVLRVFSQTSPSQVTFSSIPSESLSKPFPPSTRILSQLKDAIKGTTLGSMLGLRTQNDHLSLIGSPAQLNSIHSIEFKNQSFLYCAAENVCSHADGAAGMPLAIKIDPCGHWSVDPSVFAQIEQILRMHRLLISISKP